MVLTRLWTFLGRYNKGLISKKTKESESFKSPDPPGPGPIDKSV